MAEFNIKVGNKFELLNSDDESSLIQPREYKQPAKADKSQTNRKAGGNVDPKSSKKPVPVKRNVQFNDFKGAVEEPGKTSRKINKPRPVAEPEITRPVVFEEPENTVEKAENHPPEGGEEEEVEKPRPQLTLEEWKQQAKVDEPQFNLRKAGEGADPKLLKKLVPIKRVHFNELKGASVEESEKTSQKKNKSRPVLLDIQFSFRRTNEGDNQRSNQRRGGPPRRGGGGGYRGGPRRDDENATEPNSQNNSNPDNLESHHPNNPNSGGGGGGGQSFRGGAPPGAQSFRGGAPAGAQSFRGGTDGGAQFRGGPPTQGQPSFRGAPASGGPSFRGGGSTGGPEQSFRGGPAIKSFRGGSG